ncbi:MAG: aconitate hydratase AcnA [Chlorobiaceae bacterium]|nr:aconitate hydratase AcnA [Chlorobiaceae bacterium]
MAPAQDPFGVLRPLQSPEGTLSLYSLKEFGEKAGFAVADLPKTILVLLEAALRNLDGYAVSEKDLLALAGWAGSPPGSAEVPFKPARVVLQDFTGVPAIVDLAALREACVALGGDPSRINPLVPCDLVIDHSLQVDYFGLPDAMRNNLRREFLRNGERYAFLKWGQQAFRNFRVVPPGTGIVHQVNLEYLSPVVQTGNGLAWPDSLVGTDSHTTMINGLGVAGWGVGGIEAEAVMLGQPLSMPLPRVTGVRLDGRLPEDATATDLVLTVTQMLRKVGVVNDFVEFFGTGLDALSLPDRATIANMAPEYGATMGFFPVDSVTLDYLELTGRGGNCALVERYCKEQALWREPGSHPVFSRVLSLDLQSVEPSLAGPGRPQDRVPLISVSQAWRRNEADRSGSDMAFEGGCNLSQPGISLPAGSPGDQSFALPGDGPVVIAAITSCTNTSNPTVMIAAGLLARAARERGLSVKPWVKTSLAPGSRAVTDYLEASGLSEDLDELGFSTVGYGCTTCIGNSGPLPDAVSMAIERDDIVACAVLSGNRNFEGRIHPQVRASYLASPPLVVAYAIAGSMGIDLLREPLAFDRQGKPVYLRDLWPTGEAVEKLVRAYVSPEVFTRNYADVFSGTEQWQAIEVPQGDLYRWEPSSTYIRKPPFLEGLERLPGPPEAIAGARCLALFGDSVTTDHISPAGSIKPSLPAGLYLASLGVKQPDFNSFGSRRGNHEVMVRGTFGNIRLRNILAGGTEGGYTVYYGKQDAGGALMTIYDAAMRYAAENVPLIVIAGKDYGMGSSRDWAAKGSHLLGVRAVIACSFERIHRSNLIGMGILPLEFREGESAMSLGLSGNELFSVAMNDIVQPGGMLDVAATVPGTGTEKVFRVRCRIDTPLEAGYYRNGGILPAVLRLLVDR